MTERHSLVAPPSPGALIAKAIADSGQSLEQVAAIAGLSVKRLRRIIDGRKRVRRRDAAGLALALHRWAVAFETEMAEAAAALDDWERRDEELAKERKR